MFREIVRRQLPTEALGLWDEIESFAGVALAVQARPGETAACNPNEMQATIYLPDPNNVSVPDVVHELLHIQRYWVEKTPQIAAARGEDDNNWQIGCWLDNVLEHVVIVPKMPAFGGANDPQREADTKHFADAVFTSEFAKKQNCIAGALALENGHYTKEQGARVKRKLKAEQMLAVRQLARQIIRVARVDKLAAGRMLRDFLDIPVEGLRYQVFDIRAHVRTGGPL